MCGLWTYVDVDLCAHAPEWKEEEVIVFSIFFQLTPLKQHLSLNCMQFCIHQMGTQQLSGMSLSLTLAV